MRGNGESSARTPEERYINNVRDLWHDPSSAADLEAPPSPEFLAGKRQGRPPPDRPGTVASERPQPAHELQRDIRCITEFSSCRSPC